MTSTAKTDCSRRCRARRVAGLVLVPLILTVALSACANMESAPRDPNDKPFWEREEQRD